MPQTSFGQEVRAEPVISDTSDNEVCQFAKIDRVVRGVKGFS